jgi:hypothetical protein
MKPYFPAIIIVILLLVSVATASAVTECSKSYLIQIELTPTGATEKLTQVVWGSAPVINSSSGELRGELLAKDGSSLSSFWLWDPRVQMGEHVVIDRNGTVVKAEGTTSRYSRGDLVVQLPYSTNAATFRLSDAAMKPLVTVNLEKAGNGLTFNCTKEMYAPIKPANTGSGLNGLNAVPILAGVLVIAGVAGAGWYFLRKKRN